MAAGSVVMAWLSAEDHNPQMRCLTSDMTPGKCWPAHSPVAGPAPTTYVPCVGPVIAGGLLGGLIGAVAFIPLR
jgi:hypothetical protein